MGQHRSHGEPLRKGRISLKLTVRDSHNRNAVEYATLLLKKGKNRQFSGITDEKGSHTFLSIPKGDYELTVTSLGCKSRTIDLHARYDFDNLTLVERYRHARRGGDRLRIERSNQCIAYRPKSDGASATVELYRLSRTVAGKRLEGSLYGLGQPDKTTRSRWNRAERLRRDLVRDFVRYRRCPPQQRCQYAVYLQQLGNGT